MRNVQNTIKLACDFVSGYNLQDMADLRPMQRMHRLRSDGADDVLQLFTLLWYAWLSTSTFKVSASSRPLGSTGESMNVSYANASFTAHSASRRYAETEAKQKSAPLVAEKDVSDNTQIVGHGNSSGDRSMSMGSGNSLFGSDIRAHSKVGNARRNRDDSRPLPDLWNCRTPAWAVRGSCSRERAC